MFASLDSFERIDILYSDVSPRCIQGKYRLSGLFVSVKICLECIQFSFSFGHFLSVHGYSKEKNN